MSYTSSNPNFEDTQKAFEYKSDKELKKSKLLFQAMQIAPLVRIGTKIAPFIIRYNIPGKKIIQKTLFEQFVGGSTLPETSVVTEKLAKFKVQTILDYGIEGGEYPDEVHEKATNIFLDVIENASSNKNTPFISIKVTGLVSNFLLEKLNISIGKEKTPDIFQEMEGKIQSLNEIEKQQWEKLNERICRICSRASSSNIAVLIDAEESWLQDGIDYLVSEMMKKFNIGKTVIYNTIQLYRKDRYSFLLKSFEHAQKNNYILGLKLVRGAYMEKERKRAVSLKYASPIHDSKDDTDADFDLAVSFCLKNHEFISCIIASHNEKSNANASEHILKKNITPNHPHIHFSQLYGMSDNLTFNLANAGFNTSKYLPFGPVDEVVPYLMRRAEENSSISGQTGRELKLIKQECKRRRI